MLCEANEKAVALLTEPTRGVLVRRMTADDHNAARKLKVDKLMASKHLVVEAEGQVLVFPIANIKYMALSLPEATSKGARETLPGHAITGARIRS